jgi:hypothetical protein
MRLLGGIMSTKFIKLFIAPVALIFAVTCLAVITKAGDDKARKELEAIYAKRDKALKNKDFDFEKSLKAEDYSEKSKDGTIKNRQESDAESAEMKAMVKEVREITTKIDSVKPGEEDDEFIVETSDSGSLTVMLPDNKVHEVSGNGRSRDIWLKTEKGWKIKYHEDLGSTVMMDGKPIK